MPSRRHSTVIISTITTTSDTISSPEPIRKSKRKRISLPSPPPPSSSDEEEVIIIRSTRSRSKPHPKRAHKVIVSDPADTSDPSESDIDVADVLSLVVAPMTKTEPKPKRKFTARRSIPAIKQQEEEERQLPPLSPTAPWISASSTRNYLLKDPILDWFHHHGQSSTKQDTTSDNFTDFIMSQGKEFEKGVMRLLKEQFGSDFQEMGGDHDNCLLPSKHQETLDAMKAGVPILFSAVLHHEETKTFGIPDLIVRSDYLPLLVSGMSFPETLADPAPLLGTSPYHYRIVDVKFHSLSLRANGIHLLNSGSIPAYKSQMYVYNRALATAQGYDPQTAYLLGRKWSYTSKDECYGGDSCFERLGTIDFSKVDLSIVSLTNSAINWIREVKVSGAGWDIFKPHRSELYPNMCNTSDWPWHRAKQEIATAIGEITLLWMAGVKNRVIAHSNGIMRYDDPNITPELIGVNGAYTSAILERILEVNHPACKEVLLSANLNLPPSDVELFVDFEGSNSSISEDMLDLPRTGGLNAIFMIGVGYTDPETGDWVYRDFTSHDLSRDEEQRIALDFCDYLSSFKGKLSLIHWSHYETSQWNRIVDSDATGRLYEKWNDLDAEWVDLLRHFKERPVVVKGAYGFGLKQIVGAMYKHGLIKSSYETSEVADGEDAMLLALKARNEAYETGVNMNQTRVMKAIRHYNSLDVRVMSEVLGAVRDKVDSDATSDS